MIISAAAANCKSAQLTKLSNQLSLLVTQMQYMTVYIHLSSPETAA